MNVGTGRGGWKAASRPLLAVVLIGILAAGLQTSGYLGFGLRALTETRFEVLNRPPSGDIVVVDIDARSLAEVGVWPWPRGAYAELLDRLTDYEVAEIAIDIDFSAASTPEEDSAFAAALARAGGIVSLAAFRQSASGDGGARDETIVNMPIEAFLVDAWPAVVSVPISSDGRVWRAMWGDTLNEEPLLSMSALLGGQSGDFTQSFGIDYSIDANALETYSFVDVLAGKVPQEAFAGRKVVVGASAQELRDIFSVPVYGVLPGSVVQVLAAESIAQGRALQTRGGPGLLVMTLAAAFLIVVLLSGHWARRVAALACLAVLAEIGALWTQAQHPIVLDTSALHAALLALSAYVVLTEIGLHEFLLGIARTETTNSRRMLGQVFADSFDGIVVISEDGEICAVNRTAYDMFAQGLAVGEPFEGLLPPEMQSEVLRVLSLDALQGAQATLRETTMSPSSGTARTIEYVVTRSSRFDVSGKGRKSQSTVALACVTCRDITEKKQVADHLEFLATHDPITGLFSRGAFEDKIDEYLIERMEADRQLAVVVFSIDGLDRIIGSLGFSHGDALRSIIARRLAETLGPEALCAVIGDNRYGCMVDLKDVDDVEILASRIRMQMAQEFNVEGNRVQVTVSVGYAVSSGRTDHAQTLLRHAGNALFRAKKAGGNTVEAFQPEMEVALQRRRTLELELGMALERNELRVLYQPVVDLASSEVIGVEALMRWEHASYGMVSPTEFIPIAEESGLIEKLGAWILEKSMQDVMSWPAPLRLAVNVSPVQMLRTSLVSNVVSALEASGLPPSMLDLEITESLFIDEDPNLDLPIQALRALGCRFSLDDFGTGYSSLGYIPRFPFAKIKIDKCFVDDVCDDQGSAAIVRSVVDLAASFKMEVVAEGIEVPEQQKKLLELGCDIGQGYFFGRPMPSSDIVNLLKAAA